ncbi:calcium-binding protein [Nocardioides immobilis]|uniref:Calcium-binding protein n=1 Tax=Nocardioides immobilis TaxID=2049295 RepID=A0A417XSR5_9ACTN|nr:calcium-binding protein [Nocardioides immobilis]RHW23277.1 calcium-binding protein [Nocardioides immobilis]
MKYSHAGGAAAVALVVASMGAVAPAPASAYGPPPCSVQIPTLTGTAGADTLTGTAGRDVIFGFGGNDFITGLGGDDLLCGGEGDDVIDDGDGNDAAYGEAGADLLIQGNQTDPRYVGNGADIIDGGSDADTVSYGARQDGVVVTLWNATNDDGLEADRALGTPSESDTVLRVEHVDGGAGNDQIEGTDGPNMLFGGGGSDTFVDGGGADTVWGGDGDDWVHQGVTPDAGDRLYGDAGDDGVAYTLRTTALRVTIDARADDGAVGEGDAVLTESVLTGSGNDVVKGNAEDNWIVTGPGDDKVYDGLGSDNVDTRAGADVLYQGAVADPDDLYYAGSGRDTISYAARTSDVTVLLHGRGSGATGETDLMSEVENAFGGTGNDVFTGGRAPTRLTGGPGQDTYNGTSGNDTFVEDPTDLAADIFHGLGGTDLVTYAQRSVALDVSLDGVANDGASGECDNVGTDVEYVVGGPAGDRLTGSGLADRLDGGPGNDILTGGNGADRFYGRDGMDTIRARDGERDVVLDLGPGSDPAPQRDAFDPDPLNFP